MSSSVFNYIGIVLTSIFYGIYCVIFGLYWRIQLKRADRWKSILLYPLTASFILCTAYLVITTIRVEFLANIDGLTMLAETHWLEVAGNALYLAIDLISQLILLYRCWIMWRQLLVMVIPCILSLGFLAIALATLVMQVEYIMAADATVFFYPPWYKPAVTAFFFISLGVNTLATGLIVYKIVSVYNGIRGFNTSTYGPGQRDLYPLVSILIESGLITFVGQLLQSITYMFAQNIFSVFGGSVVMLYGISTAIVLVRVEMGVTYDHNTSKTAYSTNSRRHIPLAPFPPKFNHSSSSTTDVETQASDDGFDTRSQTKLIYPI